MADKIDQLKIGSTSYDIALPPDSKDTMYYTTGGTTSAFTVTIPDVDSLYDGLIIHVKFHGAPATSTATLNVTGSAGTALGALNLYYKLGTLANSTYIPARSYVTLIYNSHASSSTEASTGTAGWVMQHAYSATSSDTNTWRAIKVDGTQKLGTGISTGALDFVSQNTNVGDVSFTYASGVKATAKMPEIRTNGSSGVPLVAIDKISGSAGSDSGVIYLKEEAAVTPGIYAASGSQNNLYFLGTGSTSSGQITQAGILSTIYALYNTGSGISVLNSDFGFVASLGDIKTTFGSVYAVTFYASSDKRLKDNIKEPEINYIDILNNIQLKEFTWKDDKEQKYNIGVIAQEIKEVLPERYVQEFVTEPESEDEFMSVGENKLVYLALGAIKEQQQEIQKLKEEVEELKKKVY